MPVIIITIYGHLLLSSKTEVYWTVASATCIQRQSPYQATIENLPKINSAKLMLLKPL